MRLVLITHPARLGSASMPRFATMIGKGMVKRGHEVEILRPQNRLSSVGRLSPSIRKWLGYVDDYVLFAWELRRRRIAAEKANRKELYIFCDQALGIFVPRLAGKAHVVHCHDFLAQRSALGEFPENPTGWTGRQYQRMIRRGYRQGRHFISISQATQFDLHRLLEEEPETSEVIYNGLNFPYQLLSQEISLKELKALENGFEGEKFVLHVGGELWYKNRGGVLRIYAAYVEGQLSRGEKAVALWMVGPPATDAMKNQVDEIHVKGGRVRFLQGLNNEQLCAAYNRALAFVFPSLEEGFGWPPLEALACGCPVLTTNKKPMTEVGGDLASYLERMPCTADEQKRWAFRGAQALEKLMTEDCSEKRSLRVAWASRFGAETVLDGYERIYRSIWDREYL
ncbi:glycosyltransferase [Roseibacillus persicicus]|uniref:glycosyltransferase n=1 Tax=Roseibacillus persicicus TaxID=454148 RepID=UPI00280E0C22|nr:glycosyltransferase [Roseibacillus persicicus]MDQ8190602.1 glycosyltransferase [Roseibacillus persicicus]